MECASLHSTLTVYQSICDNGIFLSPTTMQQFKTKSVFNRQNLFETQNIKFCSQSAVIVTSVEWNIDKIWNTVLYLRSKCWKRQRESFFGIAKKPKAEIAFKTLAVWPNERHRLFRFDLFFLSKTEKISSFLFSDIQASASQLNCILRSLWRWPLRKYSIDTNQRWLLPLKKKWCPNRTPKRICGRPVHSHTPLCIQLLL